MYWNIMAPTMIKKNWLCPNLSFIESKLIIVVHYDGYQEIRNIY